MSRLKTSFYVLSTLFGIGAVIYYSSGILIRTRNPYTSETNKYIRDRFGKTLINATIEGNLFNTRTMNLTPVASPIQFNGSRITAHSFASRRQNLEKACRRYSDTDVKVRGRSPLFFYSKRSNIVMCKSPKAGSSFWGTIIMALESKTNTNKIFRTNRNSVHGTTNEIWVERLTKLPNNVVKVTVSRDPYTRLFSAFVDKYFLLTRLGRDVHVEYNTGLYQMNGSKCGYNISFRLFLQSVVHDAFEGKLLNPHVLPIVKLCNPCKIYYDIIMHQETLTADTRYVIEQLDIKENKKQAILEALDSREIQNTVHSLISAYLGDYLYHRNDCSDIVNYFEKVWRTLQIQGFIRDNVSYPRGEFENIKVYHAEQITSLITDLIQKSPLNDTEKDAQRQAAVASAYEGVPWSTIAKIQRIYRMDFVLFGYNMVPPHKRPGPKIGINL